MEKSTLQQVKDYMAENKVDILTVRNLAPQTDLMYLIQKLGEEQTGVRLGDAFETGLMRLMLDKGDITKKQWVDYVHSLSKENRISDRSILIDKLEDKSPNTRQAENRLRRVLEGFLDKGTKIYYIHESCNQSERSVFRTEKELKQMQDIEAATRDGSTNNTYKIHTITPVTRENMQGILEKENLETVLEMYAKEDKDKQIVVEKARQKEDKGLER